MYLNEIYGVSCIQTVKNTRETRNSPIPEILGPNTFLDEKTWGKIWHLPAYTSSIFPIRQQTMVNWYLSHMNSSINNKCCRKCGNMGTYIHCWLDCPIIYPFWQKVVECIDKILSRQIDINPQLILLNKMEDSISYSPDFLLGEPQWHKYGRNSSANNLV